LTNTFNKQSPKMTITKWLMRYTAQDIQKSITGNGWSFGNEILYKMCRNNSDHKITDVIISKV
jgi:hypothetical protein